MKKTDFWVCAVRNQVLALGKCPIDTKIGTLVPISTLFHFILISQSIFYLKKL